MNRTLQTLSCTRPKLWKPLIQLIHPAMTAESNAITLSRCHAVVTVLASVSGLKDEPLRLVAVEPQPDVMDRAPTLPARLDP